MGILEDNFNFLTKMCTMKNREAALAMVAAARARGRRVAVNGSDATDHPVDPLSTTPATLEEWTTPEWAGWMTHEDPLVPWLPRNLKERVEDFARNLKGGSCLRTRRLTDI